MAFLDTYDFTSAGGRAEETESQEQGPVLAPGSVRN